MMLRKKILNSVSMTKKAGVLAIGLDAIKAQLIQKKHCLIIVAKGAKSLPTNSFYMYLKMFQFLKTCLNKKIWKKALVKLMSNMLVFFLKVLKKLFKLT